MAVNWDDFKLAGTPSQASPVNWDDFSLADQKPQEPSGLVRRAIGDTAVSLAKGVIGTGEAAVGLANIPTAGGAGKLLEGIGYDPKAAKETLDTLYSPEQQRANQAVQQAQGFIGKAGAMLQNPSTIAQSVVESAPLMFGGGAIAQGLGKAGMLASSPVMRGAIGEGLVGAGMSAEGTRQETADGMLTPGQVGTSLASGAGTALIGAAGGKIAQKLGIGDVDTMLAQGAIGQSAKGRARRLAEGALTEGVLEEMPQSAQEQVWQNLALDRPWSEGVPEASAMGLVTGIAMGGPAAALPSTAQPAAPVQPAQPAIDPNAGPLSKAASMAQQTPELSPLAFTPQQPTGPEMETDAQTQERMRAAQFAADALPFERPLSFEQPAQPVRQTTQDGMPFERIGPEDYDTLNPIRVGEGELLDRERSAQGQSRAPDAIEGEAQRRIGVADDGQQDQGAPARAIGGSVQPPQAAQGGQRALPSFTDQKAETAARKALPFANEPAAQKKADELAQKRNEPFTVIPHPALANRFAVVPYRNLRAPNEQEQATQLAARAQAGQQGAMPRIGASAQQSATDGIAAPAPATPVQAQPSAEAVTNGLPPAEQLAQETQAARGQEGAAGGQAATGGVANQGGMQFARSSLQGEPASWVIRNKETGEVVMETYSRAKVDALNTKKYEAVPIQPYLGSLNKKTELAATAQPQAQQADQFGDANKMVGGQAEAFDASARRQGADTAKAETEHNGVRIYPITLNIGGERVQKWGVESAQNKKDREAGKRHGFGDSLHDTVDDAKVAADRQTARDAENVRYEQAREQDERNQKAKEDARRADTVGGFTAGKPPIESGRIKAALDKQYRFDGEVMTVRQRIERLHAAGELTVRTFEESKIKPMSRTQNNRASNQQQAAHEKKMRDAGMKTTYLVKDSDLGKTAYDYAQHLLSRTDTAPVSQQPQGERNGMQEEGRREEAAPKPTAQEEAGAEGLTNTPVYQQTFDQWLDQKWAANPYRDAYLSNASGDERRAKYAATSGGGESEASARNVYWSELMNAPRDADVSLEMYDALNDAQKRDASRHFFKMDGLVRDRYQREAMKKKAQEDGMEREFIAPMQAEADRLRSMNERTKSGTDAWSKRAIDASKIDRLIADLRAGRITVDDLPAKWREEKPGTEPLTLDAYTPAEIAQREATHKDPGQPAEPVTAPVIAQAIQKSARNTEFNPVEARNWLMSEIDKAIADAPSVDRLFDGVKIDNKHATYAGVKTWHVDGPKDEDGLTPSLKIEEDKKSGYRVVWGKDPDQFSKAPNLELAKEDAARIVKTGRFVFNEQSKAGGWEFDASVLDAKDFVTFDVPGDGKFKVVNTVEKLNDFKSKVKSSPGFAKNPDRPTSLGGTGLAPAVPLGNGMMDLPDIGNAIEIARLKNGKDEDKLLDRFREASGGQEYDAWRAEQEAADEIAAREDEAQERTEAEQPATPADRFRAEVAQRKGVDSKGGETPSVLRASDTDPSNQRITRAQADGFLRDFLAKFPGAPSITIVNAFDQLPVTVQQEARNQGGNAGDTKGVFHRGQVYLVSGNHQTLADFEATVFHEVVGHAGVRALFGDEFVKTANRLFMQLGGQAGLVKIMQRRGMGSQASDYIKGIAQAQRNELDQIRADMAAGKPGAQRRWNDAIARFVLTEEVFAHVAEQVTDRPSMMDKMKELIGKVRQWLRDKGFAELADMGETDILFMLSKARESLRTPAGKNGGGGITRNGVTVSGNDLMTNDGRRLDRSDPDYGSAMRLADLLGLRKEPGVTTFRNEQSTIDVDGVQRSRLNSNGQPIHPTEEGILNFWRFFKGSKVVDEQGRPLMVYRGGNTHFDETRVSEKFGAHFGTVEQANKAAERGVYGDVLQDGGEPSISTAYLKIENPWRYDGDVNNWDYIYDLKRAIEDARYDGTFPLTDEQYETGIQKHGSVDKTTPWSNRKYLETPEQLRAIMVDNGVDGVIYRNRYEGDGNSYIAFRPEQIKSATGNTGAFDPNEAPITLRRAPSATQRQGKSARERVADIFGSLSGDTARTFNWWNRTVGSQYNKTKKSPEFKRVYDRAHDFIDDVSRFANEAADRARNILPHLDTWKDIGAGLNMRKAWADAKDYQAIAPAIFEGTLANGTTGTVWSDQELSERFNLNEKQRGLYKEFRDAVNFSLDTLAKSEMTRIARVADLDAADSSIGLDETLAHYVGQVDKQIDRANQLVDEVRKRHAEETDAFVREFGGELQTGRYRKAVEVMVDRQNAEVAEAEKANEGLDDLRKSFTDKAERIQQLKDEGYAPLMRFGQYTVDVVKMDKDGKPAKNKDGEQDRPFFGMFESEAEARDAERILQEEYPDYTVTRGVLSDKSNELFKGVTPETAELFAKMLGASETEGFQAYLKQAVANRSAMKRLIQRKGMEGFSTDIPRVLASFITSNARLSSGNLHFGEMAKAVSDIPKTKGDVADEAIKLMQYIQNPQEEAAALRGLLFFNFLGGSVAAALVNTTQTFSTTLPYLNQFGARNAASAISKAMISAAGIMRKPGFAGVTDANLRDALRRASEEGIIDPQEIHLLMAESMGNGASSLAGRVAGMVSKDLQVPVNRFTRSLTQAWGGLFSVAEKYNRHVAFMAAWDVAGKMSPNEIRKAGATDRYTFAKQAVVETQFEYSKVNRPNWARGAVGATLFTFKTFMINYLEFLKRLPSREKALAVGVLFLLSGMSGAPGADDLDDLIDSIGQKLGYNWNNKAGRHAWLMETFGKDATNFIERGVSSFLPIDVSARLGMGNIIPGTGILKKSQADKSRDVVEFFGPAGSLAKGAFSVFDDVGTGKNFGELVRPVMPKAYNDAYQAMDVWQTGYYRDIKGRKVVAADSLDAFAKLTGFQPNAVAEPRRVEFMLAQSANMVRVMRADIHELWSRGIAEGDREKVQAAQDMLRTWNEKNRETPIRANLQSIQQRVRAMRMSSAERLVKATPKEMRGMVSANLVAD